MEYIKKCNRFRKMKKISILTACLLVLFTYSCADVSDLYYGAEKFVDSYEKMGCIADFSDIEIVRFSSDPSQLAAVKNMHCTYRTLLVIEFFDRKSSEASNQYRYFLVNGVDSVYKKIYYTTGSLNFLFVVDPVYENLSGTFYGAYKVTAINQDSGLYTSFDYNITAYDGRQN